MLWASGLGPSEIDYGPDDGYTKAIAGTLSMRQAREEFKAGNCKDKTTGPHTHFQPFIEGYIGALNPHSKPNYALMQVGGYSVTIEEHGGEAWFTVTNVAGMASFDAETTVKRTHKTDNPFGPSGPAHNITQKFFWVEPSPCQE